MSRAISQTLARLFYHNNKFRPTSKKAILLFLLLAAASSPFLSPSSTQDAIKTTPEGGTRPALTALRSGRRPEQCPNCPEATRQTIYAPTIGMEEAAGSRIVLNNRSPNVMEVTPTFYTEEGEAVVGENVYLQPTEIRFVNVKKLIPARHRQRQSWGGMTLSYTGKIFEVWAQIALLGVGGAGSTDVTFAVLDGRGSAVQEAAWWMPEGGAVVLALGNNSAAPLHTTVQFSDGESQFIDIAPFATTYIRRDAHAGVVANSRPTAEAVKLTTVGPPGSLRAVGVVTSGRPKYSSSIRFYDTGAAVQPHLFATNLRLKSTVPHMVLKNTTDAPVSAQPRFRPAAGEAGGVVELPALELQPQEVVEVDLGPLMDAAAVRNDLDSVSVQVVSTARPGGIIGALNALRTDDDTTYDVPLRDSGRARNLTGSYPWRVGQDYTTVVTVTNVGDQPANYHVDVRYPGGSYYLDSRELAVGESASFDMREMLASEKPDHRGNKFPKSVEGGQFHWSVAPTRGTPKLIGRAEVVSKSEKVSSSYSCVVCCPDQGPFGGYSPNGGPLYVDGFEARSNSGEYLDCYGYVTYANSFFMHTQWVEDETVAFNNPDAGNGTTVEAVSTGNTYLVGMWGIQMYQDDGMDCYPQYHDSADYSPVDVLAQVGAIQYQSGSNFVNASGTLFVLKGTSVTFKALPSPPSATFSSGKPVWGGSSGASGTGQTTSVTFNTASSSASDFKTVTAESGNVVTVNVVVYELTGVLTPENDFAGRSYTRLGIEERVSLSFTASPSITASQAGGIRWRIVTPGTGNGTLAPMDDGTGTYDAPEAAKSVSLKLELLSGPAMGAGPTTNLSIIEPSGGFMTRAPGTGLRHTNNSWSVGWLGLFHVTPGDVSFRNLRFFEGGTPMVSSGWLSTFTDFHPPSSFAERIDSTNTVNAPDQIYSGIKFAPYGVGEWHWDIPWFIRTNLGRDFQFTVVRQSATSDDAGKATISKGGRSESRVPSDPSSSW